jgi:hypothetical protein
MQISTNRPMINRCLRSFGSALLVITGLIVMLLVISAIINRFLPSRSTVIDRLSELDKARLWQR